MIPIRVLLLATVLSAVVPAVGLSGYEFTECGPFTNSGTCDLGSHIVTAGWGGSGLICCGYLGTITFHLDTVIQGTGTAYDGTIVTSYSESCTITSNSAHCSSNGITPPLNRGSFHAWCSDNSTAGEWGCYFDST